MGASDDLIRAILESSPVPDRLPTAEDDLMLVPVDPAEQLEGATDPGMQALLAASDAGCSFLAVGLLVDAWTANDKGVTEDKWEASLQDRYGHMPGAQARLNAALAEVLDQELWPWTSSRSS